MCQLKRSPLTIYSAQKLILLLLCVASSHAIAQVFVNAEPAGFVKSLSFFTTEPQPPNPPFTSVDIVFANGVERGSVPVSDNQFDLPLLPVPCDCWSSQRPASFVTRRAAYYYAPDLRRDNGFIHGYSDGIYIQSAQGESQICVNPLRKQIPTLFITVSVGQQDCLSLPSIFPIATRPRLIEEFLDRIDWREPSPLPDPFCLSCPPWKGYEDEMVTLDKIHRINVAKELPTFIENLNQLQ